MARVVRNIELTEEEAQALVTAHNVVNNLLDDLAIDEEKFFDQLDDICNRVTTGQGLIGEIISDSYDNYEIKIVDK